MSDGKLLLELLEQVDEQSGDWRVALEEAISMVRAPEGQETVIFQWSTEKGACQDCSLPAAYQAPGAYGPDREGPLYCSRCAALHASEGDTIVHLYREEDET